MNTPPYTLVAVIENCLYLIKEFGMAGEAQNIRSSTWRRCSQWDR